MIFRSVVVLCGLLVQVQSENCTTPNNEQGDCVALNSCAVLSEAKQDASLEEFIQKSICGGTRFFPMVCCGSFSNFTTSRMNDSTVVEDKNFSKESLLPNRRFCGYQHSDDYFRADNDTSIRITEFPWLARIKSKSKFTNEESFQCVGSLINTRYILTAAFCVKNLEYVPVEVRLGEYHVKNETDCVRELKYEEECSHPVEDFGIEKVITHPNYNLARQINIIGLLRLNRSVKYSDYIRPICLPLPGMRFAKPGDILLTSGWGRNWTSYEVEYKKKIFSKLITNEECDSLHPQRYKLTESQMCTLQLQNNTDVECEGDSGGPVMFPNRIQWHQEGIIAFGVGCGQIEVGERHTKVEKYVKWIIDSLEP